MRIPDLRTTSQVQSFLRKLQLERWEPIFEDIDGPTLTELDDADLKEICLESKTNPTCDCSGSAPQDILSCMTSDKCIFSVRLTETVFHLLMADRFYKLECDVR